MPRNVIMGYRVVMIPDLSPKSVLFRFTLLPTAYEISSYPMSLATFTAVSPFDVAILVDV